VIALDGDKTAFFSGDNVSKFSAGFQNYVNAYCTLKDHKHIKRP
jgi:hypothetical protein